MGKTIENIITFLEVRAVKTQGQMVVETVEDFQKLATTAQTETANLVNDVQVVSNKLAEVKVLFTTAFNIIPTCSPLPQCRIPRVSHCDVRHAYNLIDRFKTSRHVFLVLTKHPICRLCE